MPRIHSTGNDPATVVAPFGTTALSALLGETRARMLCAVAAGRCNTSELARRTGTSPPTASQHASVLRHAGLIRSHKSGKSVIHIATPLGLALLGSGRPLPEP